jgi:hypothetical protein
LGWLPEPKAERLWSAVTPWTQSLPKKRPSHVDRVGRAADTEGGLIARLLERLSNPQSELHR